MIPFFNRLTRRSPLRSADMNDLVRALNALGRMEIRTGETNRVIYGDLHVVIQIKRTADGGGEGGDILLQVDGVDNDSQDTLNLKSGSGIAISDDGGGDVTIARSGGDINFRGVWLEAPSSPYMTGDMVVIQSGVSAGTYISTGDNNTNAPDTGINWVQIAPGNAVGAWA